MVKCDNCGNGTDDAASSCGVCGNKFAASPAVKSAAPVPPFRLVKPEAVEAAFEVAEGFHRADWDVIGHWIETHIAKVEWEEAWNEAALIWLGKLRDDLGGSYYLLQSRQTALLCDLPPETSRWLLAYAGDVAATIRNSLREVAWSDSLCRDVILVFSDQDDYYQYLAYHSPDGEQAASGGMCIHCGYTHIAIPWRNENDAASAVAHELSHDCVTHLPLPLWLNEGVAVTLQKAIAPPQQAIGQSDQDALFSASINWNPPVMWEELAERHYAFWTEENIQSFWAGTSFSEPGDANELSYSLAEVFVKLLSEGGNASNFREFILRANQSDAGQTSAVEVLNADLGEIAGTFLGEGNWRPQRKAMVACWQAAGWEKQSTEPESDQSSDRSDPPN